MDLIGRTRTAALAAFLMLCIFASPATASTKSCAASGYKVEKRFRAGLILSKPYRGTFPFEPGAVRRYACSRTYRKSVLLGVEGVHPDGESWTRFLALNKRYAAVARGGGGNAGGGSDYSVEVRDLKTGRLHSAGRPGTDPAWYGVIRLVMKPSGDIAYIARISGFSTSAPTFQVWSRTADGQQLLATADNIDITYLEYGPNGEVLWRIAN